MRPMPTLRRLEFKSCIWRRYDNGSSSTEVRFGNNGTRDTGDSRFEGMRSREGGLGEGEG